MVFVYAVSSIPGPVGCFINDYPYLLVIKEYWKPLILNQHTNIGILATVNVDGVNQTGYIYSEEYHRYLPPRFGKNSIFLSFNIEWLNMNTQSDIMTTTMGRRIVVARAQHLLGTIYYIAIKEDNATVQDIPWFRGRL